VLRGSLRAKKLVLLVAWELQLTSLLPQHVLRLAIQQLLPAADAPGLLDGGFVQNDGRGPRNSQRVLLIAKFVFVVCSQCRIGPSRSAHPEPQSFVAVQSLPELQSRRGKATDLLGERVAGPTEPEGSYTFVPRAFATARSASKRPLEGGAERAICGS
jgi:hypothetical protein